MVLVALQELHKHDIAQAVVLHFGVVELKSEVDDRHVQVLVVQRNNEYHSIIWMHRYRLTNKVKLDHPDQFKVNQTCHIELAGLVVQAEHQLGPLVLNELDIDHLSAVLDVGYRLIVVQLGKLPYLYEAFGVALSHEHHFR